MELWDAEFIDMLDPGYFQFDVDGRGQFVFGAVQGGLDCHYSQSDVHFTWAGSDDMDEASGDGDAELEADGALKGEIRFHLGDESSPADGRFSAACSHVRFQGFGRDYRFRGNG